MSWLKKASWNIRFNEEIKKEIDEFSEWVTNYYMSNTDVKDVVGLSIKNPYNNNKEFRFKSVISPEHGNWRTGAAYDATIDILFVYPYNIFSKGNKDRIEVFNAIKSYIQHEFVHVIDPKMRMKQFVPDRNDSLEKYYNNPIEFDAYSKQIIENLKLQLESKPDLIYEIESWIRKSSIIPIPDFVNFQTAITYWNDNDSKNKTQYIRRFKSRIFNEIISNREIK